VTLGKAARSDNPGARRPAVIAIVFDRSASHRRRWGGRETDMNANSSMNSAALASSRLEALKAAAVALVLGFGLVWLAGFAYPESVHDAAHDTRHALSFPCH
jgi:cobalt transporter subunit CbtB